MKKGVVAAFCLSLAIAVSFYGVASADRFSSTSYIIDASVMNNFGGYGSTSNYQLTSSGGEALVGNGAGGSYKIGYGYVSNLEKSLSLTVQPSGLVAMYPLDETTGTAVADQSINNAYGAMQGTLNPVSGKIGGGIGFDGATQVIPVANNTQTRLSSEGTVEAWVKSSTTTGSIAAVSKASNFWLGLGSGKATTYDWTSGVTTSDSTVIADGNWHHIAITLNSGISNGSTLYVDGVSKKTFTWTPQYQTGTFTIGGVYNGTSYTQYFNGSIDHVKVLNRSLSADEMKAEYDAQNDGHASGLTLGTITPGVSNTTLSDIIVQTDSNGYTLAINQDNDLTNGAYSIPAISGSIASPAVWTEGTTKGLGFTLTATNATTLPGTWGGGANYAALPAMATSFYTRTGTQAATNDYLTMRLRTDVSTSLPTDGGLFSNIMTITGTITP